MRMLARRPRAVVCNHITQQPLSMYDGTDFIRLDAVYGYEEIAGKGLCYRCRFKGEDIELWRLLGTDRWFVEEELEEKYTA